MFKIPGSSLETTPRVVARAAVFASTFIVLVIASASRFEAAGATEPQFRPPAVPLTSEATVQRLPASTDTSSPSLVLPTNTGTEVTSSGSDAPAVPTLSIGSRGEAVKEVERRLDLLRFDVGDVDGRFDGQTWQAVVAFQKLNQLPKSGRVTAGVRDALAKASVVGGLIPNGGLPRVEVDLGRQVLMLFDEYGLLRVLNISSGSEKKYCQVSKKTEQEVCGDARTPRGNYRIQRRIKGWRESDLGRLYNPLYFDGGFAIHGSPSVPAYPASHGCVRISMKSAEWFPAAVANGTPVYLFE